MALIDLRALRSALERGLSKYRTSEQLKLIRINIKHFERSANEAYRNRNIVLFNSLRERAAVWKQAEIDHLAGVA